MGACLPVAGQYFAASPGLPGSRVIAMAVRMLCLNLQPGQQRPTPTLCRCGFNNELDVGRCEAAATQQYARGDQACLRVFNRGQPVLPAFQHGVVMRRQQGRIDGPAGKEVGVSLPGGIGIPGQCHKSRAFIEIKAGYLQSAAYEFCARDQIETPGVRQLAACAQKRTLGKSCVAGQIGS